MPMPQMQCVLTRMLYYAQALPLAFFWWLYVVSGVTALRYLNVPMYRYATHAFVLHAAAPVLVVAACSVAAPVLVAACTCWLNLHHVFHDMFSKTHPRHTVYMAVHHHPPSTTVQYIAAHHYPRNRFGRGATV